MATMTTTLSPLRESRGVAPSLPPVLAREVAAQLALTELFPDQSAAADAALAELFPALRLRQRALPVRS